MRARPWAFEILSNLGIKYDSSIFPAHHAHGGMPSFPKAAPTILSYQGMEMKEFPVCFKTIAGKHIVFSGGGYFRLFPYPLIKKWHTDCTDHTDGNVIQKARKSQKGYAEVSPAERNEINERTSASGRGDGYLLAYIHPRDLDGGQPMLEGLPLSRKFKSYVGCKGAAKKLERWLTEFEFTDIATANQQIDWTQSQRFEL